MRFATVVATSYQESPSLPSFSSGMTLAHAWRDRLKKPDAGFAVEWLNGHRSFPEELEQLLGTLPTRPRSMLLYFSGYLVWQPERAPALALDGARPRAYPLPRLCALLDDFAEQYLIMLDVALTVEGYYRQTVADAVCDVLGSHAPRAGGLIGITPAAAINGGNAFTMLALQSLAQLAEGRLGAAGTARGLFEQMGPALTSLLETHAVRYLPAGREFVLLPERAEAKPGLAPPPRPLSGSPITAGTARAPASADGPAALPHGSPSRAARPAPSPAPSPPELEQLGKQARRHAEQQDWWGLANVYEAMLEHAEHGAAHEIAGQLAALCRFELEDPWRAMRALERVVAADGGNAPLRFDLSDLYITTDQLDLAVEHCLAGLAMAPRDASAYRRARWLFERTRQADKAWNALSALRYFGWANQDEALLVEAHRPAGLLAATATLSEDHWQRCLAPPKRHRALEQVVEIVTSAAIAYRLQVLAKRKQLFLPEPSLRQDPKTSTTMLCRSLTWTAGLLGVTAPELYVYTGDKPEMKAVPAAKPTTVVSKAFASGLTLPQLAFLWARHLTYFRPAHYLRVFYPSVEEMTSLLLASMHAGDGDLRPTQSGDPELARLATHLHQTVNRQQLELLHAATRKLTATNGRARVLGWAESIVLGANRAGLVACGDVGVAAAMVERFPVEPSGVDQVADLMRFALSDRYAELRHHIGVAVRGS